MPEETFTEGATNLASKTDANLALVILVATVVVVVVVALYIRKNQSSGASNSWKQTSFTPPVERAEFIAAKEKLDPTKVADLDELKKLLMRRAIQTIPILLSHQNEGSSIDRLYKRGMLTDDMHFKVKELKAFVDKEFQDIQFEADDLLEGWGQHIWPQAMQFHQMIQKQAEAKNEEQRAVEDEKKKSEAQKRKDKEKAKKQIGQEGGVPSSSSAATAAAPSSSSSAAAGGASSSGTAPGSSPAAKPARVPRVIRPVDPEELKIQDAERMAQQLLEEEEREQKKGSAKKGGKK